MPRKRAKTVVLVTKDLMPKVLDGLHKGMPEADSVWSYLLLVVRHEVAEYPAELIPALRALGVGGV